MPPLRVLAIDDEEVARYLLRECLPVPAFELTEAATAAEGLRRAREDRPDVILVDLVMPDLDGRTVLRMLRTDPATAGAALLVVTSQTLDQREQDAVLRDADALLSKADVTRGTLGDAIRAVRARTLREAPQPAADAGETRAGGSL
jgi:CheY-like chemotaxis protein